MADISSEQIKALLSNPETLERIASMVESFGGSGLSQLLAGSAPESDVLPQKEPENAALSESSVPPTKPHAPEAQEAAAMLPAASGISPSAPLGALLSARQAHHASKGHPSVCQRCKKRARGRIGTRVECGRIVEQL